MIKKKLDDIHNTLNLDPLNSVFHQEEKLLTEQLNHWLTLEEEQLRQKCRVDWLTLGDRNTKFFYAMAKVRSSKNQPTHLIDSSGTLLRDITDIRKAAPNYFKDLFSQDS